MNFLIPANTKKGKLIFGVFQPFDLILFGAGIFTTLFLLAFMPLTSTFVTILVLLPGLITGFLVLPVPYYHNILTVLIELYEFLTSQQKYKWRGWCVDYGEKNKRNK